MNWIEFGREDVVPATKGEKLCQFATVLQAAVSVHCAGGGNLHGMNPPATAMIVESA